MIHGTQLTEKFWQRFLQEHWLTDRPLVIEKAFPGTVVRGGEILTGLKEFRRVLKTLPKSHYNLILGRTPIEDDYPQWLPTSKDTSFDKYWSRITRKAGSEEIFFQVYPFWKLAPASFWARFRGFLKGMQSVLDVSPERITGELFVGNYTKSLVGVHKDNAAVFCFVAKGKKRVRVWPPGTLPFDKPNPGVMDYEEYLDRSILLEGEAGDVLFWPASYWHIAEAERDLSISISVAVYQEQIEAGHTDLRNIYSDPAEYDRVLGVLQDDIPFFVERARASGGPVLELGCGTGRVTIPIARAGVEIVGLDGTAQMLQRASQNAESSPRKPQWVWSDFRDFSIEQKFSLIFIAYSSIHHISDFRSFSSLFARIREHLDSSGTLIISDWNPGGPAVPFKGERRPSAEEIMRINRLRWFKGKRSERFFYFYPKEYEALLKYFGFQIEEMLGDPNGSPYRPDSLYMILVCKPIQRRKKSTRM